MAAGTAHVPCCDSSLRTIRLISLGVLGFFRSYSVFAVYVYRRNIFVWGGGGGYVQKNHFRELSGGREEEEGECEGVLVVDLLSVILSVENCDVYVHTSHDTKVKSRYTIIINHAGTARRKINEQKEIADTTRRYLQVWPLLFRGCV